MSEIQDTSSVEDLYQNMIGPDTWYQQEGSKNDTENPSRWWGMNKDKSFTGATIGEKKPANGKYYYTGGNGLLPDYEIGVSGGKTSYYLTPQLEMIDANGNKFYAYCIDQNVDVQVGLAYDMLNIEDASYLTEDQKKHIQAIARYGFWGTLGGEESNKPMGSLAAIVDLIQSKLLTMEKNDVPEELRGAYDWFKLNNLRYITPGIAQAATQAALWVYGDSGKISVTDNIEPIGTINPDWLDKGDNWTYVRLREFLASDYLVNLMQEEQPQQTESRILGPDDLSASLTVKGPQRNDGSYLTDLTFDLNGSVNEGDDLVLKLKVGEEEKTIRISGAQQEGEIAAVKGERGYTIPEIALFPSSELTLSLSGTQQISSGVYIFQHESDHKTTQTMVGLMTEGTKKTVDLTTTLKFNVTEAVQRTTETVSWLESRTETTEEHETPGEHEESETPETPVTPAVPGYDVPKTGDASGLYAILALLSALGLAFVTLTGRKRRTA